MDEEVLDKLMTCKRDPAMVLKELDNLGDVGEFTLQEIADVLGLSRERVRQIESAALKKMKHPKIAMKLKRYVDDANEIDRCVF